LFDSFCILGDLKQTYAVSPLFSSNA